MCLGRSKANVFGHVHNNITPGQYGPRYFNVSLEVMDYTPVSLEDLSDRIDKQLGIGI
jgi:calcineurin-like phosphoesterase family protein